jgi:hypothetical protein
MPCLARKGLCIQKKSGLSEFISPFSILSTVVGFGFDTSSLPFGGLYDIFILEGVEELSNYERSVDSGSL